MRRRLTIFRPLQRMSPHPPSYAMSLVERIFACTGRLADHPELGGMVPEHKDESLREMFKHPYRIVYRVLEQRVDVVALLHATRKFLRGMLP